MKLVYLPFLIVVLNSFIACSGKGGSSSTNLPTDPGRSVEPVGPTKPGLTAKTLSEILPELLLVTDENECGRFSEQTTGTKDLNLESKQIISLQFIRCFKELESLNLNFNKIVDLTPLEGLVSLKSLDLGTNEVIDIHSIRNLVNLENLNLEANEISQIEGSEFGGNLKRLNVRGNKLDLNSIKILKSKGFEELNTYFNPGNESSPRGAEALNTGKFVVKIDNGLFVSMVRDNGKTVKPQALQVRTHTSTPIHSESGVLVVYNVEFIAPNPSITENPTLAETSISSLNITPKALDFVKIECSSKDDLPVSQFLVNQPRINQYIGKCRLQFTADRSAFPSLDLQDNFSDFFDVEMKLQLKDVLVDQSIAVSYTGKLNLALLEKLRGDHKSFQFETFAHKSLKAGKIIVDDLIGSKVCNAAANVNHAYEVDCESLRVVEEKMRRCQTKVDVMEGVTNQLKDFTFNKLFKILDSGEWAALVSLDETIPFENTLSCDTELKKVDPDFILRVPAQLSFKD
ncbi:MAG: hypothetical protein EOP04_13530 [Proteobacteria bacterium]|nr:MAG: hypothetical protein EOP04_13530 [Pseudomonadota bacterium]